MDVATGLSLLRCFGGCGVCKGEIDLCLHHKRDLTELESKREGLRNSKKEFETEIQLTTPEVELWKEEVEKLCTAIDSLAKNQHINCCICWHRYRFGADVAKKSKLIVDLERRLKDLRESKRIVKKSDIERLRQSVDGIVTMKTDLENKYRGEQFTEVVKKWIQDVILLEQRKENILPGLDPANSEQQGELVVKTIAVIGDLMTQRLNWKDGDILVEKYPKQFDVERLERKVNEIRASKRDLEKRNVYRELTDVMDNWMHDVDRQCQEGEVILHQAKSCGHDYQLGKKVIEMCNTIQQLQERLEKLDEKNMIADYTITPVLRISVRHSPQLVGVESKVSELLDYLRGDKSVIGIVGAGGIGKTTLLKELNNTLFRDPNPFSRVIFVTISQDFNACDAQKIITDRLGVSTKKEFLESNVREHANILCAALTKKPCLLLLDDVWKELDLSRLGISTESINCSKAIISTRFKNICSLTGVDEIVEMKRLDHNLSWQLFSKAAGGEKKFGNSKIREIASDVAELCDGLPLVLKVVGQAVVDLEETDDWEETKIQLSKRPEHIEHMEERVLPVLRYSFDRLNNDVTKKCFLHCLVFGEREYIDSEKLINHWIEENLLDEGVLDYDHPDRLRNLKFRGRRILSKLIQAFLLEEKLDAEGRVYVRMHDMIYGMAMWVQKKLGQI